MKAEIVNNASQMCVKFSSLHLANKNQIFQSSYYNNHIISKGIVWFRWRGWDYTLKRALMMIKPKGPTTTTTTVMI